MTLSHIITFLVAWVMSMIVRPWSAKRRNSRIMLYSVPGSRPLVGSSRKKSRGLVRSSTPIETRLSWPPERFVIGRSLRSVRSRSPRTSVTRLWRSSGVVSAGIRSLAA